MTTLDIILIAALVAVLTGGAWYITLLIKAHNHWERAYYDKNRRLEALQAATRLNTEYTMARGVRITYGEFNEVEVVEVKVRSPLREARVTDVDSNVMPLRQAS